MKSSLKLLTVSALALTLLSACGHSGNKGPIPDEAKISLAQVPGDIRVCFGRVVGKPMPGAMTEKAITQLISDLRKSEKSKSYCGKRLLRMYDTQAARLLGQ